MQYKLFIFSLLSVLTCCASILHAAGLENRTITIKNNERFDFVNGSSIQFKFKPLSDQARALEITENASALGVAYLGQVQLKENITALSVLRSIADQIGESLDLSFGVIADSNTSEALRTNELLLLYHPDITITLALARPDQQSHYEIICTYALKDLATEQPQAKQTETFTTQAASASNNEQSDAQTKQESSENE